MLYRVITFFTTIFIVCGANFAQSLSIDLDTTSGIQSTFTSRDTSTSINVAIRFTGVSKISSYQFKVSFDTTRFTFIGAQQDFGISGEKNILTKNSGSIIGIAQLQLNPPAKDTVEFSYSITGNNQSLLISGDGLAGVLSLKSKVPLGDSSSITVSNCILADFDLNQTQVNTYCKGTYWVMPVTKSAKEKYVNSNTPEPLTTVSLTIQSSNILFDIPSSDVNNSKTFLYTFYTLNGKYLTEYNITNANSNYNTISGSDNMLFNQPGRYICSLKIGSRNYSQIISFQ
jgi:hypothetical protein